MIESAASWSFLREFSSTRAVALQWSFLERFGVPAGSPVTDWASVREWSAVTARLLEQQMRELAALAREWDERLRPLGGEPAARDWTAFRPLRLSREEDWSDWLAHLLEAASTGGLCRRLFGEVAGSGVARVLREVLTEDATRRADIVILWPDAGLSVEVKVGDEELAKTAETARGVRRKFLDVPRWNDFILLPPDSLSLWRAEQEGDSGKNAIRELTWSRVALALRRELWSGDEDIAWRAWALAFSGAIEQVLLGYAQLDRRTWLPLQRASSLEDQIELLTQGRTR